MARRQDRTNVDWQTNESGAGFTWEQVAIEVLMDMRQELREINRKLSALECPNFISIPRTLKRISSNTAKPRPKKKPKLRVVA